MSDRTTYFAYGSNMAIERLKSRISSAQKICNATLVGHILKFHKVSKDGSGKCDAAHTGNASDKVIGVLYSIKKEELGELDKYEGCGYGYERKSVIINSTSGEQNKAETYVATRIDPHIRPFDWYKEHVLQGATSNDLPTDYIAMISSVAADIDHDINRRTRELAIYRQQSL